VEDERKIYQMKKVNIIEKGTRVVLLCASYEDAIWFYSTTHNEINSNITLISESPALEFDPIQSKDTGYYYCYGTFSSNHFFVAVKRLKVYGKHTVVTKFNAIL